MSKPEISPEAARAFDDLRRGMAKHMGVDPADVDLVICRPNLIEDRNDDEEFFYAGNF